MIMAGGEALKTTEFQGVAGTPTPERPHLTVVKSVQVDRSRDDLLTDFGKKTLEDRYLLAGEKLSGHVRARFDRLLGRRRTRPAPL